MKKNLLKSAVLAGAALLLLPAAAAATGIIGQCADCHTMHNSEQGQQVAVRGLGGEETGGGAIMNLLRMDCIACHAQDPSGPKIAVLDGGSAVPQVYHGDTTDLAGGNFRHLAEGGARKGHNVVDLFDTDPQNSGNAPGDLRNMTQGHNFEMLTCAGAKGCHGTRSQALQSYQDGEDNITIERVGIAAVSGAHHQSFDGAKEPEQIGAGEGFHDGTHLASSYRFLRGLKGYGNETDRWQNVNAGSHNEYYGSTNTIGSDTATGCNRCHVPQAGYDGSQGRSARFALESTIAIPNQSMSGLCITCHGNFHSSGGGDIASNGASGAFLRHPSDYVIPNRGEYAAYTEYNITAPVARPTLYTEASSNVTAGTDMVMCLSCHQAHATPYDGMLRFDYADMVAGDFDSSGGLVGCMACHTTKGDAGGLKAHTPGDGF
ncbi:hypothetical protein [Desulfurivibrio alkaliphilus]|uniref:Doubled CXXCH motif domain-containing protein n=1 Tax=Desulfurivibrio alkaliphilus (strain DSM 19089 / UNIQEM U267 / AHT2) TaxID=589865 RepID=D6YZV2_DESAT|nr:hypothetical protein [Desulfurivibrio alkaliphilus]ADH85109.1 hypothetical protein DaAHT2_0403 [Desulfurivibrio alkaliphilus AHT 2]